MPKKAYGKELLTTLEELVLPQHTALIVVDVQNDFCSPGGCFDRLESSNMEMMQPCIDRLAELLEAARRAGTMIVYIQATNNPDYVFKSAASLACIMEQLNPDSPQICIDGGWGHQIVDKVQPLSGELTIRKHRHGSFAGTELDMLLRSNGIKTVIVTGGGQGTIDDHRRISLDVHSACGAGIQISIQTGQVGFLTDGWYEDVQTDLEL